MLIPHETPAFGADMLVPVVLHGDVFLHTNWAGILVLVGPAVTGFLSGVGILLVAGGQGAMSDFLVFAEEGKSIFVDEGLVVDEFGLVGAEFGREQLGECVIVAVAEIGEHGVCSSVEG